MPRCTRSPQDNWDKVRYLNKPISENERNLHQSFWEELIGFYGTEVEYYTYNYSLTAHDYLYGEQPTASFDAPVRMIMMADLPSESIMLSKFGIQTDADITLIVTMEDFQTTFGNAPEIEPKSGDVIRLTEAGFDSTEIPNVTATVQNMLCTQKDPDQLATINYGDSATDWIRCPQLFEITEYVHQDFSMNVNTLLGHYVWIIRGKRFDYSYQPNIVPECYMGDVGEETRTGILSGGTQPQSPDKDYPQNVDTDSNENIWDYDKGEESRNDKVYGEY